MPATDMKRNHPLLGILLGVVITMVILAAWVALRILLLR
jgi:4-hydroxybenzoate polyprenyltransferase